MKSVLYLILVLGVGLVSGCPPSPRPAPLSGDPALDAFAREIGRSLEAHDWQPILAAADPDHYRIQVVEGGMGEPQYVAELFGLHRVDNNIRRGEIVSWSDLERIDSTSLRPIEPSGNRYRLTGTVLLTDDTTLDLQAQIVEQNGRYRLTGGVG